MDTIEALFQAAENGDAAALRSLLEAEAELANRENGDGLTLLGYAAHYGDPASVEALLDSGADVNALSHSTVPYIPSNTALQAAIAGKRNRAVIELLLARGARVDIADSNGHAALHVAAMHDEAELIELLVQHGADVNAPAADGRTALRIAREQEKARSAEALAALGALETETLEG